MSVNSSASYSNSLLPFSVNSTSPYRLNCFFLQPNYLNFTIFTITNIFLLLPLCVLILHHGLRWWWNHSSLPTAETSSHSDSFTYQIVTIEIINISGTILFCCASYSNDSEMLLAGFYVTNFTWYVKLFFHVLTCVEHYLAVVHPITYLSLKEERWIRFRNIMSLFIWLICCGWTSMTGSDLNLYFNFCLVTSSFLTISFCSVSVLCALICAGPKRQRRVDQSKHRASCTVTLILGVLLLRCSTNMIWGVVYLLSKEINECFWNLYEAWLNIPSSLVLPLLFLQRTGKLACCKNNIK